MRLDEWQKYIDSEFVETTPVKSGNVGLPAAQPAVAEPPQITELAPALQDPLPETALAPADEGTTDAAAPSPVQPVAIEDTVNSSPEDLELSKNRPNEEQETAPAEAPTEYRAPQPRPVILTTEIDIAPFSEYISERRGQPESSPPTEAELIAPPASAPAEAAEPTAIVDVPAEETAVPVSAGVIPGECPLTATPDTLARLKLLDAASATREEQAARHRKAALMRRMCDPVLTAEDAALLLGVPASTVARYAASGLLVAYTPASSAGRAGRRAGRETILPGFRLSDIVAFITLYGESGPA